MQRNAGKMGGALAGAGAAFAAAGAVVGGVFVKAFTDAMSQEQSVAKLSAQVGAFGGESKKLGKVAGSLYADGYGEGFDDVTEALRSVKQNMKALGISGDEDLKKVSKGAMNVASILGEEVGPTTRAVAKMIKTGLAKDADEAFDILTRGAQTGANEAQDLLDTFSEYSTQFRNMGLDGKQAMGLITQGLQAGARDADVVADTIKEFSIEAVQGGERVRGGFKTVGLDADDMVKKFAKGGPAAAKAFDQVLDKLRGIEDPAKRNAAAVELFGTKAEDMGEALFALDPSKAAAGLGEVGGSAKKAGDMLHSSLTARLEKLKRTMQQGLVDMINDHVMPVINKFSDWMKENPQIVKPVVENLKLLGLVFGGLAGAGAIVAGIGFAFGLISWPVLGVVAAIAGLTLGLKYAWENSETFRDIVMGVWNKIKEAAAAAVAFFKAEVVPTLTDAWESIKEKGQVLLDFFQETLWPILKEGWNALVEGVQPIIERFKGFFDDLAGKGEGLSGIWQNVTGVISEKLNEVWSVIEQVLALISEAWETHKGWIVPTVTFIFQTIGSIIGLAMGNIWETIKGIWTAISGVFSGAMQVIKGIIQLVMGIITLDWQTAWNGIKNIFGGTWNAIVAVLKGAWQIITGVLNNMWNGIKAVFLKIWNWLVGNSLVPDLVNAIIGWFTKMRDRAGQLISNLRDWVVQRFTALKDRVVGAVTSLRDRAVSIFTSTRDRIYNAATWLRDKVSGAFNSLKDKAITAFTKAKDGIGKVWDKLKAIAAKPVNFVINSVYNQGIRKFWNAIAGKIGLGNLPELGTLKFQKGGTVDLSKGGKLPGFSSKDNTLAMVRSGEGVLVPEATQALGGAQFIHSANRMKGRAGQLLQGQGGRIPGFMFGGIVDAVGGFIQKGKDFFKEGFVKALNGVTSPIVNAMKSQFTDKPLLGLPTLIVKSVVNKIKGFLGPKSGQLEGGDGRKVVDVARSQTGYYGRPNKFTKAPGMWTDEWCGMFVDWVFKKANAYKALSPVANTPAVRSYTSLQKVGRGSMRPGDLALYRGDAGHINIVTDPKSRETVGGNESNNRVKKSFGYVNSASSIRRPRFARGGVVEARDVMRAGGLENLRDIAWQDRKESPHVSSSIQARRDLFAPPPWVSRDMGGILPDGMMAYNTSGTAEVVTTIEQLKALVASGKGATYIFNEGAIQLDASKVKSVQDLVEMIAALKVTSRQFGARL
jgi:phage-related protein